MSICRPTPSGDASAAAPAPRRSRALEHDAFSTNGSVPEYPVGMFTRWARRAWRRAERQLVRDHEGAVASRLSTLQLPVTVTFMPETGRAAIVRLRLPGWQILISGVALRTRVALSAAARSDRLRLSGGGRYGRFWWLSIDDSSGGRVVLLGSHCRLNADLSRPETHHTPPPDRRLVVATLTPKGRWRRRPPSRYRQGHPAPIPAL